MATLVPPDHLDDWAIQALLDLMVSLEGLDHLEYLDQLDQRVCPLWRSTFKFVPLSSLKFKHNLCIQVPLAHLVNLDHLVSQVSLVQQEWLGQRVTLAGLDQLVLLASLGPQVHWAVLVQEDP